MEKVLITPKAERLEKIEAFCRRCGSCRLHKTRTKVVFGEGSPDAPVVFIGEGPGREEDMSGRPFVGRSGKLLRRMIQAIELDLEKDCFIANIVKCRPPGNRDPEQDEIDLCIKYLKKQLEIIFPNLIVLLGRTAVRGILPQLGDNPMFKLREMKDLTYEGIRTMVTYHPSALLRGPKWHQNAKEDFEKIRKEAKEAILMKRMLQEESRNLGLVEELPF